MKKSESFIDKISRLFPLKTRRGINSGGCRQLTLQITEDCNLRCSYCYQTNKTSNKMSLEVAKDIINCLFEDNYKIDTYYDNSNLTGIILEFIGGEPFLEIDLIDEVMEYFLVKAYESKSVLGYRYMISLCSNGVLYNTEKVQKFLKKWRNHVSLTISLDGNKELHDSCRVFPDGKGSYDLAEKAAKSELIYNNRLSTKMTLAPGNIQYFSDAIKNLVNIGYKEIHCNCVFEEGWTSDHAKILYQEGKKLADWLLNTEEDLYISFFDSNIGKPLEEDNNRNWCGGTGLMLSANYKGEFFPCLRYMESSLDNEQEPLRIGDLTSGVGKLDKDKNNIESLSIITRRSQSTDECFYCSVANGCAWCSAYNYQKFGTANKRATFICIMHKARVLLNCYYWNKYYRKNDSSDRYKLYLTDEDCLKIINEDELELLKSLEKGE